MKTCSRCILPENFPGANLDSECVCAPCREYEAGEGVYGWRNKENIEQLRGDYDDIVEKAKDIGSEYGCLVPVSGGKDSTYLAKLTLEKEMNPLLFHAHMEFHPNVAHENLESTIDKLREMYGDVDFASTSGDDYYKGLQETFRKVYKHRFENPNEEEGYLRSICYSCGPLLLYLAMDKAVKERIPIVLVGYSPGQVTDFMFYKMSENDMMQSRVPDWMTDENGFTDDDKKWYWNPENYPEGTRFPDVVAPFHVMPYNESEVIESVVKSGLIKKKSKAHPMNTNCKLIWPMVRLDLEKFGFDPFVEEFAGYVRRGEASRWKWKSKFMLFDELIRRGIYKNREMKGVLEELGFDLNHLKQI